MKTKNLITCQQEPAKGRFHSTVPYVFSIPRPYEDAIVDRDKNMYAKMQQLQNGYLDLKKELFEFAKNQQKQYEQTCNTILVSNSLLEKYIQRKQKDYEDFF